MLEKEYLGYALPDGPPPDRCGTCTRCIDACPTEAIVPIPAQIVGQTPWSAADPLVGPLQSGDMDRVGEQRVQGDPRRPGGLPHGAYTVDSRLCISYFTIELRGAVPEELREGIGKHVFGCDICQDVCPWNRHAPVTREPAYQPRHYAPPLEKLASLTEEEFRALFRGTPVTRARYSGFLRNVAIAMGNARLECFRGPLEKLAASSDALVAGHARWGLGRLALGAPDVICQTEQPPYK